MRRKGFVPFFVLALCCVLSLTFAGCVRAPAEKGKVESIRVENQRTEFEVNKDVDFEKEDIVVWARYTDGSEERVNRSDCNVYSDDFDVSKMGTYTITVRYEGKSCDYEVHVVGGEYTLTLDSAGGSDCEPLTVKFGEKPVLPEPVRAPYTFGGWYTGIGGNEKKIDGSEKWEETEDATLYAYWLGSEGLLYDEDGVHRGTATGDVVIQPYYQGMATAVIPDYAFSFCDDITSVHIPDTVWRIYDGAFLCCTGLESVTLPDSLGYIPARAFRGCTSLRSVSVPDSVTYIEPEAFFCCRGLRDVRLGSGLRSLYDAAFGDCSSLESITIPDSVTDITSGVFRNCRSLKTVTVPGNVETIGDHMFAGCSGLTGITVQDGVKTIGTGAFENCTALRDMNVSDTVKTIGEGAFRGCTALTDLALPSGVEKIEASAFRDCTGLRRITVPASVTEIRADWGGAFEGCLKLIEVFNKSALEITAGGNDNGCAGKYAGNIYKTEDGSKLSADEDGYVTYADGERKILVAYDGTDTALTLPAGTTGICGYAFLNRPDVESVTVPASVEDVDEHAFAGCSGLKILKAEDGNAKYRTEENFLIERDTDTLIAGCAGGAIPDGVKKIGDCAFSGRTGLKTVTIPASVTEIGVGAFENCVSLTDLTIPDTVTSVSKGAFKGCVSLKNVTVGGGVASLPKEAFKGCVSLENVTVGAGVRDIGDEAFMDCASLEEITIPDTVTDIGSDAFSGCSGLMTVKLPSGLSVISDGLFHRCVSLKEIDIPSGVGRIKEFAFDGCESLTAVEIPSSVTYIAYWAFAYCESLKAVNIPSSVTDIERDVFYGCIGLESITADDGNAKYRADENCLIERDTDAVIVGCKNSEIRFGAKTIRRGAFLFCNGLVSITIPASVTSIEDAAFDCLSLIEIYNKSGLEITAGGYDNGGIAMYARNVYKTEDGSKLHRDEDGYLTYTDGEDKVLVSYEGTDTELTLPDGITEIAQYAFSDCPGLRSITIPASVRSIMPGSFAYCDGLEITVAPENIDFRSEGGCLIANDGQKIISGSDVIPARVSMIYQDAFKNRGMETLTVPAGVSVINATAFGRCADLQWVILPDGLREVSRDAFAGCRSLSKVYFEGTEDQWNDAFSGNECPELTRSAKYWYSETKPATEGNYWHYDEHGGPAAW